MIVARWDSALSVASEGFADSPAALVCRVVLAAVLITAGATKLRAPTSSAIALVNFRVLRWKSDSAGLLLGILELSIGIGIVAAPSQRWPAATATALFACFTLLISAALRRGDSFPCACVGRDEEKLSAHTLVRSIMLLLGSCLAFAAPVAQGIQTEEVIGAVTAGAAICGLWSLGGSLLRNLRDWQPFLDDEIDWQLAAELNDLPGKAVT